MMLGGREVSAQQLEQHRGLRGSFASYIPCVWSFMVHGVILYLVVQQHPCSLAVTATHVSTMLRRAAKGVLMPASWVPVHHRAWPACVHAVGI